MRYVSMNLEEKSRSFSLTPFHATVSLGLMGCMVAFMAILSWGWAAEGPGAGPVQAPDGDVFSRISLAVKKVHTMSSAFEQERRTAMLKEAMISKGRFFFAKPDKIRWETSDPGPEGFSVNGQEARRWQGASDSPEKITLSDAPFLQVLIQQIVAWTSADFSSLKERYDLKVIREDPATLGLVPLLAGERDYVSQVTLVFSSDLMYVTSVKIQEKKGDEIVIRFLNAVINEPIADDYF